MGRKLTGNHYYYLTLNKNQHRVLKDEAEARGTTMARLLKESLNSRALKLPDVGGVKDVSVGIRVSDKELARYRKKAADRGMKTPAWMRSRLFQ